MFLQKKLFSHVNLNHIGILSKSIYIIIKLFVHIKYNQQKKTQVELKIFEYKISVHNSSKS